MGLPRTAWLQAAAWVLREAGEEEQGACGCWGSPRWQEYSTLGAKGQRLELLLLPTWEPMLPRVSSEPAQGPSWAQAGGGRSWWWGRQ